MKIAVAQSVAHDTRQAVLESFEDLRRQLGAPPQYLWVTCSALYDIPLLISTLNQLAPSAILHGGTSCQGIMSNSGFHSHEGFALGLWGLIDPEGSYGVGMAEIGHHPREAGAAAIQQAIEHSGRIGEPPQLVWMSSSPGNEEEVLLGIEDVIGSRVPIAGGTTADNTVLGHWRQFTQEQFCCNAVVVTAMYPSVQTHFSFHSGYSPTSEQGIVTRCSQRVVYEIDGQSAAQVYNRWTGGSIQSALQGGGNTMEQTSLFPLGRVVGYSGSHPYYRLSHPASVTPDGGLVFFAQFEPGDQLILMSGTVDDIVSRVGVVTRAALGRGRILADQVAGAMVVYCAGCMMTVRERMDETSEIIRRVLDDRPFLGTFSFGEQGCFIGGENRHGNLMISLIVFESGETSTPS